MEPIELVQRNVDRVDAAVSKLTENVTTLTDNVTKLTIAVESIITESKKTLTFFEEIKKHFGFYFFGMAILVTQVPLEAWPHISEIIKQIF